MLVGHLAFYGCNHGSCHERVRVMTADQLAATTVGLCYVTAEAVSCSSNKIIVSIVRNFNNHC